MNSFHICFKICITDVDIKRPMQAIFVLLGPGNVMQIDRFSALRKCVLAKIDVHTSASYPQQEAAFK